MQSAVDEGSNLAGCALPVSVCDSEAFPEALGARNASNGRSTTMLLVAFTVLLLVGCHDDSEISVKFHRKLLRKESKNSLWDLLSLSRVTASVQFLLSVGV